VALRGSYPCAPGAPQQQLRPMVFLHVAPTGYLPRSSCTMLGCWHHDDVSIPCFIVPLISFAYELRSCWMICPFQSSWRSHRNGWVQFGILCCLWQCHTLFYNCSFAPATKYTPKLVEFVWLYPYSYGAHFHGVTFVRSWWSKIGT
jgi:hypothetical protein